MPMKNMIKKDQGLESNIVKFQNNEKIYFPKICIICGIDTENEYNKTIFGTFETSKDHKEDYYFSLPICNECKKVILKERDIFSKKVKILLISSIIGLIFALSIYFLTYSIFLSISLFAIVIIIPYLKYKSKIKYKIRLNNFLKIKLGVDKKTLIFEFFNQNYSKYINEINLKKESSEKIQKETTEA